MATRRTRRNRNRLPRAALTAALLLLAGCGESPPEGLTGRVGASFRTDLDIDIAGTPLHLIHADRCIEYRLGGGSPWTPVNPWGPQPGKEIFVSETGGFSAERGGWRVIVPVPMMCDIFSAGRRDSVPPPDQQAESPQHSLSPDYLPLIAAEPVDGSGPLRLYLSREALTRPGEPVRLRGMTATIPDNAPIPDNARPVPLRRMLLGEVPGRCFRAWLLSPADPDFWHDLAAPAAFAAQTTTPELAPAAVIRALDPWGATPVTQAQWQKQIFHSGAVVHKTAYDLRAELYLMQGALSFAPRHLLNRGLLWDNESTIDHGEWVSPEDSLASSLAGWGVLSAGEPLGRMHSQTLDQVVPEHLLPLTRIDSRYRPAENQPGTVVEYTPDPDTTCLLPPGPITVAVGQDSLSLAPFAVFYWPEKKTFYRLIPSALRLP